MPVHNRHALCRGGTLVAASALAVLAGTVSSASAASPAPDPPGCKAPKKFFAAQYAEEVPDTYVRYCEVCFDIGAKSIHDDYKLAATDPRKIAIIYAKKDERGFNRLAGTQGCIRGFALRGKP